MGTGGSGNVQRAGKIRLDGVPDRQILSGRNHRTDSVFFQVMDSPGTHSAADDRFAVMQQGQQSGMAVPGVPAVVFFPAVAMAVAAVVVVAPAVLPPGSVVSAVIHPGLFPRDSTVRHGE